MPARSRRAWRVEHVRWSRCGRAEKGLPRSGNRRSCADRGPDEPSRRRLDGRLAHRTLPDPDRRRRAHRARTAGLRTCALARDLPPLLHAGYARRPVLRMDAQRLRTLCGTASGSPRCDRVLPDGDLDDPWRAARQSLSARVDLGEPRAVAARRRSSPTRSGWAGRDLCRVHGAVARPWPHRPALRADRCAASLTEMRFGFWMPVFGGWLRNVDDEGTPATFAYQRDLARQAERTGWDVTLIAELNLNDIKGPEAGAEAVARALCGRRVAGRERPHRKRVRCVSHARRPARRACPEDRRYARASCEASGPPAAPVWRGRVRDRPTERRRGEEGDRTHHRRARERARLRQLPGLHQGFAAGDTGLARGLQRLEPWTTHGSRRHAGPSRLATARARAHRHRSRPHPVQPAARGDGSLRGGGVSARRSRDWLLRRADDDARPPLSCPRLTPGWAERDA